uniref:BED-type domain-containing protein n=1 Tax=Fagus sylvatica TaxID=28930 RepID=A0A2N9IWT7_FAGSY
MNEEVDEFGESASSVSKKTRCRTSTVWSEFELEPIGVDGQQKAKCKWCNRTYAAGDNGTTSLLRHAKKCSKKVNDGDEIVDRHRPTDQDMNTAKQDVIKIYKREKESPKICFKVNFWEKKVLSFSLVPPPRGGAILADRLLAVLQEWGIDRKIFSITLDNASYNETLVNSLKENLSFGPYLPCSGEFFHVRCGAHVLNLIVQDGLKVIDEVVHNIRESVKYVKGSDSRRLKFAGCLAMLPFLTSKKVRQDVPTRWNSTYLMIETCLKYRRAFVHLSSIDSNFNTCPSEEEWDRLEKIANILEPFYDITVLFSGTNYPTTNLYFHCVWRIQLRIMEQMEDDDEIIRDMAKEMRTKFDKYWECYSVVLSFAVIFYPRYKLQCVEFCYKRIYGEYATAMATMLRDKLFSTFEEYLQSTPSNIGNVVERTFSSGGMCSGRYDRRDDLSGFDTFESELVGSMSSKSQLKLSLMDRDILSIPITSVASESAFNVGGRILDKFRSSLLPLTTEALLCARDWMYGVPGKGFRCCQGWKEEILAYGL